MTLAAAAARAPNWRARTGTDGTDDDCFRFPLLGVWTGRYHYGPIPIEGFLFSDAGVAWTSTIRPSFAGGVRDVVRSAGAGVRVNAFGYAIVELAMARPFDRTRKGWVFSFNLRPGY